MKKLVSLGLTVTLLCSFLCVDVFATDTTQKTEGVATQYVKNVETEKKAVHESSSECEILIPKETSDYSELLNTNQFQTSIGKSQRELAFELNETSATFSEKIIKSDFTLDGSVVADDGQKKDISDFLEEEQVSRFDIIDIAYKNNIISEYEKMSNYCDVYELGYFENTSCLHPIIVELNDYYLRDDTPSNLKEKISSVLMPPTISDDNNSRSSTSSYDDFDTENFIVYYDPEIELIEAIYTAQYLEDIREEFLDMGFKEPRKELFSSKYKVYLKRSSSSDGSLASTFPVSWIGVTCSTYIEVYNFSMFDSDMRENLVHEYFHAIQGAYMWSSTNVWFDEAMSNWATIAVAGTSSICEGQINQYLNSTDPIYDDPSDGYGVVLFPLTIQNVCGINGIKSIWKEYGKKLSTKLSFEDLKKVVDDALDDNGESFDSIFLKMAYYNFKPSIWYHTIHPGGYSYTRSWVERITQKKDTISAPRSQQNVCSNEPIKSYSNAYYKFVPDVLNRDSKLTITVTFSGAAASDGVCHSYYETSDGRHIASNLIKTGTNKYTITSDLYGGEIIWMGVVVSNIADSNINYSITYNVEYGSQSSATFVASNRYSELIINLDAGEYRDYVVSFVNGGNKIIQTFGTKDAYLELFNMNGTKLAGNSSTDDAGYEKNALISYNFAANTQYRIRVTFYNPSVSGDVKLAIVPAPSLNTYEEIYSLTDYTLGLTSSLSRYNVMLLTYRYMGGLDLTMNVSSEAFDTYLYIIDPRSTAPLERANQELPNMTKNMDNLCNDDSNGSTNSQITKRFFHDVPYLVIVSAFNPSSVNSEGQFYVDFE